MELMNAPRFLITDIITSHMDNMDECRKALFEKGVLSKDYPEDGLVLCYHKYDSPVFSELERECRSLVIEKATGRIVSYSCETPRLNNEGMEYLISHPTETRIINPCYEGTYLSVFCHNTKWYVSTRRCLDSQESFFKTKEGKSHYSMFEEVLQNAGYSSFYDFTTRLDQTKSYYFVLLHHENKHLIDYTETFGENYTKVCLTTVRDSNMVELDIYADRVDFASYDEHSNIFVPSKLDSVDEFAKNNKSVQYHKVPNSEGIVVRVWDSSMNKYHLIKLQSINYQFMSVVGSHNSGTMSEENIYKGFIYLYQHGKLLDYFDQNDSTRKITNPLNVSESYDTVGVVDSAFKVCTSELFELFKHLWDIKTGKHRNKALYDILPKEYRDVMYAIRGLYFKKKSGLQNFNRDTITPSDVKTTHLKISDIYNYLKSLSTETFVAFLRMRKLMFNWVRACPTNVELATFGQVSVNCDRVNLKLCAILSNRLFPNVIVSDLPPQKESN